MKVISLILCFMFGLSGWNSIEESHDLTVHVSQLRNNTGVVQFALYNKEGSIPDEKYKKQYKIGKSTIQKNAATFVFSNLPEGTYAINILHDENRNGQIDKGFILPVEGIGFSNYTKIGLTNRPNYKDASFELKGKKKVDVKVIYM